MDFLDPQKQRRQNRQLLLGYILVGIAILIATIIMVELVFGYNYKNGKVVQNGLVFLSSQPNPAAIYFNGKTANKNTNTGLQLPEGSYLAKLVRNGYRPWQRTIHVAGGDVQHFDYPFLFPTTLATKVTKTYPADVPMSTQSPDRHWLLLADTTQANAFVQYDLNNPKNATTTVVVPDTILTKPAATDTLKLVEWSTDNRHVLLQHIYDGGQEYVMLDRQTPADSINLTNTLKLSATQVVSLRNKAYDQYFILDSASQDLSTASIGDPTITPYIEHVLAFKSYGADTVLYATPDATPTGKTTISLRQNGTTLTLRQISAAPPYLLDLTKYSGDLYVVGGDSGDGKVYIFKNPTAPPPTTKVTTPTPLAVLRVEQADFLSFSNSAQYIMIQKANAFAVYDILNSHQYSYATTQPIDAPQANAAWMDGDRLEYVSGGKLVVFDYDYTNVQTLVPADPDDGVFYDRNYKVLYALAPSKTAPAEDLTSTSLLIPADQ